MSALLTANRDALAKALDRGVKRGLARIGRHRTLIPAEVLVQEVRDALLASGAVVDASTLADDARAMAAVWGGDSMWITTGTKQAELMAEWIESALAERGDA